MAVASRGLEAVKIVLFATGAAVAYGVLHDQVTAHVCIEYFSVAHPPLFSTESPFLLALGWGVIATWWVGLLLGIALAVAARAGSGPQFSLAQLRRPIVMLMIASGIAALAAGATGAVLTAVGKASVPGGWGAVIPPQKHAAFSADAWAHLASYATGTLGGLFIIGRTVWQRIVSARC